MARRTMKRIWSEGRTERIAEPAGSKLEGLDHRIYARVVADRGETEDGGVVLRIEKTIQHWPPHYEDPCEDEACRICGGGLREIIVGESDRRNEQRAIRLAIQHADALFDALLAMSDRARHELAAPPEAA